MKKPLIYLIVLLIAGLHLQSTSAIAQGNRASANMEAYYPMTGNANDASGHGHDLTVKDAQLCKDRFGNNYSAYYFNGSASLSCTMDTREWAGITLSAWVKTSYTTQQQTIIQPAGNVMYINRFVTGDFMGAMDGSSWDNDNSNNIDAKLCDDKWHFVCASNNGTLTKIYVDGKLGNSYQEKFYRNQGIFIVGLQVNNEWGFTGAIDDIQLYDNALSDAEIADLYKSSSTASIADIQKHGQQGFMVYPNPSNGHYTLHIDNTNTNTHIKVLAMDGREILSNTVSGSSQEPLDLSAYPPGIYLLRLENDLGSQILRLVKE